MAEKIYVLGAGASKAAGAPLANEFLRVAYRENVLRNDMDTMRFLRTFYPLDKYQHYPDIEEVLTLIDLAIQKNETLSFYDDVGSFYQLRDELYELIESTLSDTRKNDVNETYLAFANELEEDDVIISLNYDISFDNALLKKYHEINYGIKFEETIPLKEIPKSKIEGNLSPLFLKLHGSINWKYCQLCGRIYCHTGRELTRDDRITGYNPKLTSCPYDQENKLTTAIVYPTWLKSYSVLQLQSIWNLAYRELRKLEEKGEITFIGYSLPDSDMEIRYLFKKAAVHREDLTINVINKDKSLDDKYRSFFGDITYVPKKFENWVRDF